MPELNEKPGPGEREAEADAPKKLWPALLNGPSRVPAELR